MFKLRQNKTALKCCFIKNNDVSLSFVVSEKLNRHRCFKQNRKAKKSFLAKMVRMIKTRQDNEITKETNQMQWLLLL